MKFLFKQITKLKSFSGIYEFEGDFDRKYIAIRIPTSVKSS